MKFIARTKELSVLKAQLAQKRRTAVLVYGKRRIGKSTLIAEAARDFNGVVINHLCAQSTYEGNLDLLSRSVSLALGLPIMHFATILDLFHFLETQPRNILVIIDECQYFKNSGKKNELDSYMQTIIDSLPEHIKLILCGSYITIMKELLEEENPLFGRFTAILHLEEMNYYEVSLFAPNADARRKIENYAIFGGSPYVQSLLDPQASVQENIERLLLPVMGTLRVYIENIMLKEIQKAYDVRILAAIGNGKKKYSDIQSALNLRETGALDKQLKNLMDMETIAKVSPINRPNDRRKRFYLIRDNLMRFYFTYLFGNNALISRLGEEAFFRQYMEPSLLEFISRRFEDIACQYFSLKVKNGTIRDIYDIGSYWYDDPVQKKNGKFDCVLKKEKGYDFFECKFYREPMSLGECRQEEEQVRSMKGLDCHAIGFVCSAGFDFDSDAYHLISGDDLFRI